MQSFSKSQFLHNFVNLSMVLVMIKDTLTNLWGNRLLVNDFIKINTFCEIRLSRSAAESPPSRMQKNTEENVPTGMRACAVSFKWITTRDQ